MRVEVAAQVSARCTILPVTNPSGPYWLADLLTGYSVEGLFVQPANSIDLARLLANATPDEPRTE
jgi:hypothetical protein